MPQTIIESTATTVVVQVDIVASGLSASKIDLYFSVGIPNGYTELLDGVSFDPKLISLSTREVSIAGSIIYATVEGAGVNDALTLIDSASQTELCLSSTMLEYSVLECELNPSFDLTSGATLAVKEKLSGQKHDCDAADPTACDISLLSSQPLISTVIKLSASQIRFTGTLFPTSGVTCSVIYANTESDSCTISSASEVVADFTYGIALQEIAISPILSFTADDGTYKHLAEEDVAAILANPYTASSITTGLTSSFAGGQLFTVQAQGLAQSVI